MITINKIPNGFEATFLGGNLLAFNVTDLLTQLTTIYGFKIAEITKDLFTLKNLN